MTDGRIAYNSFLLFYILTLNVFHLELYQTIFVSNRCKLGSDRFFYVVTVKSAIAFIKVTEDKQ